jgi:hypothetical protein
MILTHAFVVGLLIAGFAGAYHVTEQRRYGYASAKASAAAYVIWGTSFVGLLLTLTAWLK